MRPILKPKVKLYHENKVKDCSEIPKCRGINECSFFFQTLTVNMKKVQKNKSFELIFLMHLYTKTATFQ